jgi:hypothetical protein
MKPASLLLIATMAGVMTTVSATPCGRFEELKTAVVNNAVMLCLPESGSELNQIAGIRVVERSEITSGLNVMWSVDFQEGHSPLVLKPGECVEYGKKVSGYQQKVPAQEMIPGTYYARVNINLPERRCDQIFSYDAVFSVEKKEGDDG